MADIITADNLPLVIGAIGTLFGGILASRHGGRQAELAKREATPSPETLIGGLVMSNIGSSDMIGALRDIAKAVREATEDARAYRSSRTNSLLARIEEKLGELETGEKPMRDAR